MTKIHEWMHPIMVLLWPTVSLLHYSSHYIHPMSQERHFVLLSLLQSHQVSLNCNIHDISDKSQSHNIMIVWSQRHIRTKRSPKFFQTKTLPRFPRYQGRYKSADSKRLRHTMKLMQEHLLTTNQHDLRELPADFTPNSHPSTISAVSSLRRKFPPNFLPTISGPLENPALSVATVSHITVDPASSDSMKITQNSFPDDSTRCFPNNAQHVPNPVQSVPAQHIVHNHPPDTSPTSTVATSPVSSGSVDSHTLTSNSRYNLSGTFTDIWLQTVVMYFSTLRSNWDDGSSILALKYADALTN